MCGCGVVRTCMAVAGRGGLAPREAEKLTAGASSVAIGGPMTCVSGVRWGDGWASRRESSGRKFDSPGFLRGEGCSVNSLAPLALISGRLNTCERWDGCVVGGRVAAIERVASLYLAGSSTSNVGSECSNRPVSSVGEGCRGAHRGVDGAAQIGRWTEPS